MLDFQIKLNKDYVKIQRELTLNRVPVKSKFIKQKDRREKEC